MAIRDEVGSLFDLSLLRGVVVESGTLLPEWWNWYTRSTQNAVSSGHVGSSPTSGTCIIGVGVLRPTLPLADARVPSASGGLVKKREVPAGRKAWR
jgi:hypothetical protein